MKTEVLLALFSKLLEERLESLPMPSHGPRGHRGHSGPQGEPGKDFVFAEHEGKIRAWVEELRLTFDDLNAEQIEQLRGPKGRDGKDGRDGKSAEFNFEAHKQEITDVVSRAVKALAPDLKLKFEDLNEEEISMLRGPRGQRGLDGKFEFEKHKEEITDVVATAVEALAPDLKLKFEDLSEEEVGSLRGPRGQRGAKGKDFVFEDHVEFFNSLKPTFSDFTAEERESLKLHFTDLTESERDELKLKFENLSESERLELRGPRGQRGKPGIAGSRGDSGRPGLPGPVGVRGERGFSGRDGFNGLDGRAGLDAPVVTDVEVLNKNGDVAFVFSFSDGHEIKTNWVTVSKGGGYIFSGSLVGGTGGSSGTGSVGGPGPEGKSAYQIWLDVGNVGTEQDFLDSLVGPSGAVGLKGDTGAGIATSAVQVIYNIACEASVFVGAAVRMSETGFAESKLSNWVSMSDVLRLDYGTYTTLAVNALADQYAHSNVVGIVENKPTTTTCDIRIAGITPGVFYALDVTEEYYLSDTDPGRIVQTIAAPTKVGHVLLKLGQPISFDKFLYVRGDRLVRGA